MGAGVGAEEGAAQSGSRMGKNEQDLGKALGEFFLSLSLSHSLFGVRNLGAKLTASAPPRSLPLQALPPNAPPLTPYLPTLSHTTRHFPPPTSHPPLHSHLAPIPRTSSPQCPPYWRSNPIEGGIHLGKSQSPVGGIYSRGKELVRRVSQSTPTGPTGRRSRGRRGRPASSVYYFCLFVPTHLLPPSFGSRSPPLFSLLLLLQSSLLASPSPDPQLVAHFSHSTFHLGQPRRKDH